MKRNCILILLLVIFGSMFAYAEVCDYIAPSIDERVENRDYPSIFGSWAYVENRPPILPALPWSTEDEPIAYFDLSFSWTAVIGLKLKTNDNGSIEFVGDIELARERKSALLKYNPNAVLIVPIRYYSGLNVKHLPEEHEFLSKLLLRDETGEVIIDVWNEVLLDFTLPATQKWVIDQAKLIASCGLFDGVFLDHWSEHQRLREIKTLEEEHIARDNILKGIRDVVSEDFLIMANTNDSRIPRWAEYINGTFLEANPNLKTDWADITDIESQFHGLGYDRSNLIRIEDVLIWSENNFREPRINSMLGFRIDDLPPDAPQNKQLMRVFTTMNLTLSDGYVLFKSLAPEVNWYDFWDVELGTPVSKKTQTYQNREGLYIREFTQGWVVYNRSGSEQTIEFGSHVSGKSSEITALAHTLPDLDGEIYIKTLRFDINNDGVVNILDLVIVANALGESKPDLNGDGIVNILDLVLVSNNFGN